MVLATSGPELFATWAFTKKSNTVRVSRKMGHYPAYSGSKSLKISKRFMKLYFSISVGFYLNGSIGKTPKLLEHLKAVQASISEETCVISRTGPRVGLMISPLPELILMPYLTKRLLKCVCLVSSRKVQNLKTLIMILSNWQPCPMSFNSRTSLVIWKPVTTVARFGAVVALFPIRIQLQLTKFLANLTLLKTTRFTAMTALRRERR
jgi:hypothetical protein